VNLNADDTGHGGDESLQPPPAEKLKAAIVRPVRLHSPLLPPSAPTSTSRRAPLNPARTMTLRLLAKTLSLAREMTLLERNRRRRMRRLWNPTLSPGMAPMTPRTR
jgi:hypothetical protein